MDEVVLRNFTTSFSKHDLNLSGQKVETIHEPVGYNNVDLVFEILTDLEALEEAHPDEAVEYSLPEIQELLEIMYNANFQALMEAHDLVANKNYEPAFSESLMESHAECPFPGPERPEMRNGGISARSSKLQPVCEEEDGIRLVGLRRGANSNLQGMTVRSEKGQLIIARILAGSPVDKQGLLHVGDVIKEVNGHPVKSPLALQQAILCQPETVTLKVSPSWIQRPKSSPTFLKAYFSYDPHTDRLLPSTALGLRFVKGDILEVLNMDDDTYWQARHVGDTGSTGLIPSQVLQEHRLVRKAHPANDNKCSLTTLLGKKKQCISYGTNKQWLDIDRHELIVYDEVMCVPAFPRRVIVLIGPLGTARRKLVSKLVKAFPEKYGYPLPRTSRPPRVTEQNGREYYFCSLEEMKRDIAANQYAEFGKYAGNYYGTKSDSIRFIVMSGKTCVLDCGPQCMKLLRTKEFLPFIVFVARSDFGSTDAASGAFTPANGTPARSPWVEVRSMTIDDLKSASNTVPDYHGNAETKMLLETYGPYVDLILDNDDCESAFRELVHQVTKAELEDQWIPVSWMY